YVREVNYTPTRAGTLPIVVVTSDLRKVTDGWITTLNADGSAVPLNLSGVWLDAANGSVLQLTHSFTAPTAIVATLNLFDTNGAPRWYVAHSSSRINANTWVATLVELSAKPGAQCGGLGACPSVIDKERTVGVFRIEALSDSRVRVTAHAVPPAQGTSAPVVFFAAEYSRLNF
ncbi:MAG: hypothetical protein ACRDAM_13105, partial [Casimicrobium sp.]